MAIDDIRYLLDDEARGYKSKYERDDEEFDEREMELEDDRHEDQAD